MSDRITRSDVDHAFGVLVKRLPESKREGLELVTWAPGDGCRRYRIERMGQTPFGAAYWMGAAEAYNAMWSCIHALEYVRS